MIGRDGAKQDARRLTEEIEAATNAALSGGAAGESIATRGTMGENVVVGGTVGDDAVTKSAIGENAVNRGVGAMNIAGNGVNLGRGIISTMDARVLGNDGRERIISGNDRGEDAALKNGALDARVLGNGAAILGVAGERAADGRMVGGRAVDERAIGGRMTDGRAEAVRRDQQAEIVTGMAEVDNGYGKEYIPGVMTAENESPYEIAQRKQLEAVNQWNEDHPNGSSGAKRVARDQEEHGEVARDVMNREFLNQDFEVVKLLTWFGMEQTGTLNDLEIPHPIGEGND